MLDGRSSSEGMGRQTRSQGPSAFVSCYPWRYPSPMSLSAECKKCPILLARPEGFEPPTPRFVVWCSIQLSYGRFLRIAREMFPDQPRPAGSGPFPIGFRSPLASLRIFAGWWDLSRPHAEERPKAASRSKAAEGRPILRDGPSGLLRMRSGRRQACAGSADAATGADLPRATPGPSRSPARARRVAH